MPTSSPDPYPTMKDPGIYRIAVAGRMLSGAASVVAGMAISERLNVTGGVETILVGRLQDQAELFGVLKTLYEMHLPIISANCMETG